MPSFSQSLTRPSRLLPLDLQEFQALGDGEGEEGGVCPAVESPGVLALTTPVEGGAAAAEAAEEGRKHHKLASDGTGMGGSGKQLVRRGSLEVLGESTVTGRRPTGRVASSIDVSAAFGALWPQSGGPPALSVSTPCPSSPTTRASHTSWTRCVGGPTAFLPEPV